MAERPLSIPDQDIKDTVTADVVVVGAGFAGLCAALAAVEAGLMGRGGDAEGRTACTTDSHPMWGEQLLFSARE